MRGADVNVMLNGRFNALHVAASNGHASVVRVLLNAEADINAKDGEDDRTALGLAAWNGHESVVRLLLEYRDVDIKMPLISGALMRFIWP